MAEHIEIAAHHPRPGRRAPVELHVALGWASWRAIRIRVIVINGTPLGHHYVWIMRVMSGGADGMSMCGPRWPTSKRVR